MLNIRFQILCGMALCAYAVNGAHADDGIQVPTMVPPATSDSVIESVQPMPAAVPAADQHEAFDPSLVISQSQMAGTYYAGPVATSGPNDLLTSPPYGSTADVVGNPYEFHFGPGYYRSGNATHYRFPYYSYRRPWYYPGHAVHARYTNLNW